LQIVNAVKAENQNWSKYGHTINGIKERMCLLRLCRITNVKRDANSAAHSLVREVVIGVINSVWMEEITNCIHGIVIREQFSLIDH
jgi:hypothetical protein